MIIKGWGLAPRPSATEAGPNAVYIDLSTNTTYVVEDGGWHAIPYTGKQELPDYTAATQGKALFIDDTGKPAWDSLPQAANQAASEASTVAALKADLNTLLSALKTAGLMAADSE